MFLFFKIITAHAQECDGVRVLSRGFHDLIHRVEEPVQEIYKIGSMSPGSILLMASQVSAWLSGVLSSPI